MSGLSERVAICNADENSPNDFVWGTRAIGREINRTERQTYHLLSRGSIKCARKIKGGGWVAHRGSLRREFGAA